MIEPRLDRREPGECATHSVPQLRLIARSDEQIGESGMDVCEQVHPSRRCVGAGRNEGRVGRLVDQGDGRWRHAGGRECGRIDRLFPALPATLLIDRKRGGQHREPVGPVADGFHEAVERDVDRKLAPDPIVEHLGVDAARWRLAQQARCMFDQFRFQTVPPGSRCATIRRRGVGTSIAV